MADLSAIFNYTQPWATGQAGVGVSAPASMYGGDDPSGQPSYTPQIDPSMAGIVSAQNAGTGGFGGDDPRQLGTQYAIDYSKLPNNGMVTLGNLTRRVDTFQPVAAGTTPAQRTGLFNPNIVTDSPYGLVTPFENVNNEPHGFMTMLNNVAPSLIMGAAGAGFGSLLAPALGASLGGGTNLGKAAIGLFNAAGNAGLTHTVNPFAFAGPLASMAGFDPRLVSLAQLVAGHS